jgi:hypothetical protein
MKKKILGPLLLLAVLLARGQEYFSIINENAIWSVSHEKFTIIGDTLINEIVYNKIYYHDSLPDLVPEKLKYVGAIREESELRKVWFIYRNSTNESLLYDFSLEPGDKATITRLPMFFGYEWSWDIEEQEIEIQSVDEIEIDGTKRKILHLKPKFNVQQREFWIEGIGSSSGLVYPGFSFSILGIADIGYPDLLCYSINSDVIYRNEILDTCYFYPLGVFTKEEKEQVFNIQAFLYNENAILLTGNHNLTGVEIFDITGRLVVKKNFNDLEKKHYIYLPSLNRGIYIIKAYSMEAQTSLKILR